MPAVAEFQCSAKQVEHTTCTVNSDVRSLSRGKCQMQSCVSVNIRVWANKLNDFLKAPLYLHNSFVLTALWARQMHIKGRRFSANLVFRLKEAFVVRERYRGLSISMGCWLNGGPRNMREWQQSGASVNLLLINMSGRSVCGEELWDLVRFLLLISLRLRGSLTRTPTLAKQSLLPLKESAITHLQLCTLMRQYCVPHDRKPG